VWVRPQPIKKPIKKANKKAAKNSGFVSNKLALLLVLFLTDRAKTLLEAVNTATGVNVTLLTSVERVTSRTYV